MSEEKEIIIDGVDVSLCEYFIKEDREDFTEEAAGSGGGILHNKNVCGLFCGNCKKYYCHYKQLKRLQEENEELKKRQITKNGFICDCEQNAKYKQALEEIRSYCDEQNLKADYTACYITNRIDEVLNDN